MKELSPIIKGCIKHLLFVDFSKKNPGGGNRARYYYSVFLRHIILAKDYFKLTTPKTILEIGPGSTLGIGICALLTGCNKYYAMDVIKYWDSDTNISMLHEIADLFMKTELIPDLEEFPNLKPHVQELDYTYSNLFQSFNKQRIHDIENSIKKLDKTRKTELIEYHSSFNDKKNTIPHSSVDFIISQAVLEHVEDLDNTYKAMYDFLKVGGLLSHVIDFKSHGITKSWDGHWQYNDFEWRLIKGHKKFLINRLPLSCHIRLLKKYNFKILEIIPYKKDPEIKVRSLDHKFKNLSFDDLSTAGVYFLAIKI